MIEDKLNNLRKTYIKTKPTEFLVKNGWDDLRVRMASEEQLEREESATSKKPGFISGLIFASLLLLLIPTVSFAQNAKEGDFLYPVKILSNQVVSKVTNTPIKTEQKVETKQEIKNPVNETIKEASNEAKKIQENIQKQIEKDVKGIQSKLNQGNSKSKQNQQINGNIKENKQQNKDNQNLQEKKESSPSNQDKNSSGKEQDSNTNQNDQGQNSEKKK